MLLERGTDPSVPLMVRQVAHYPVLLDIRLTMMLMMMLVIVMMIGVLMLWMQVRMLIADAMTMHPLMMYRHIMA